MKILSVLVTELKDYPVLITFMLIFLEMPFYDFL